MKAIGIDKEEMKVEKQIINGMSFDDYRRHPSVANSDLTQIAKSPAHYQFYKTNPQDETDAMIFGRALHKLLLEPEKFDTEFVYAPEFNMRTKDGKAALDAFTTENKGKQVLFSKDKEELGGIVKSINDNSFVRNILNMRSVREVSIFWTDKETGVECKGRPDLILTEEHIIVDLKSSRDAGADYFAKALYEFRYFTQAAFYSDGYEAITGHIPQFCFIVFEKEPPYACAVYLIDQRAIHTGREVYKRNLATYKKCTETGIWEGYPKRVIDIDMPEWVYKKLQNEGVSA